MEPVALAYRSMVVSSSSGDPEGFSTAEDDLEQQQQQSHANKTATASEMRKKRLLFARLSSMSYACDPPASSSSIAQVRRRLSNEDITKDTVDVVVTPPPLHGILKQGRYTTSSTPSSSSNHLRRNRAHKTFSAMFLIGTTVSFIIGSVANVLNGGQLLPTLLMTADSRRLKSSRVEANKATHDAFMTMLRAETAGLPEEERQRRLAVGKSTWPRCVNQKLSAIQCKEIIDQDILDLNTDTDKFVRTIIVGKRNENDPLSNSIVLFMDDNDRVMGRDGDGKVYYDFKWSGSGNEATRYQQRKIPPIVAKEVSVEPTIDSIEVEIVPIRTLGASTYDAIGGAVEPISGGVQTLGLETDTALGSTTLNTALSETATIEQAGERTIGPFDCSGMTGRSCCLMIKHKIRDADTKGRAIQCYLDYHEQTEKAKALLNARGKKVFIFENHKGRISKEPKVVGDWPQGIAVNEPGFHDWIQDGGGLSNGQMRLIHGPDWQPPGQV